MAATDPTDKKRNKDIASLRTSLRLLSTQVGDFIHEVEDADEYTPDLMARLESAAAAISDARDEIRNKVIRPE